MTSMFDFASRLGFVPGVVKLFIALRKESSKDFSELQKSFLISYALQVKKILRVDLRLEDPMMLQCYLKCLGIISLNREVRISDYNFLVADIPWTYITQCSPGSESVKAVSTVVADIVQDFLYYDGDSLELKVSVKGGCFQWFDRLTETCCLLNIVERHERFSFLVINLVNISSLAGIRCRNITG